MCLYGLYLRFDVCVCIVCTWGVDVCVCIVYTWGLMCVCVCVCIVYTWGLMCVCLYCLYLRFDGCVSVLSILEVWCVCLYRLYLMFDVCVSVSSVLEVLMCVFVLSILEVWCVCVCVSVLSILEVWCVCVCIVYTWGLMCVSVSSILEVWCVCLRQCVMLGSIHFDEWLTSKGWLPLGIHIQPQPSSCNFITSNSYFHAFLYSNSQLLTVIHLHNCWQLNPDISLLQSHDY